MNLFTFNSRRKFRWYSSLFLVFYVSLVGSFLTFYIKPSLFYWRAWEYSNEIPKIFSNVNKWIGQESGDLTRRLVRGPLGKHHTVVSWDGDGFRSIPVKNQKPPIAIFGDSHIWGSGLSDNETIPWIVSEELKISCLNAGKYPYQIFHLLHQNKFEKTKIVIEIFAQHLILEDMEKADPLIFKNKDERNDKISIFEVSSKRYFIFNKIFNFFCSTKQFKSFDAFYKYALKSFASIKNDHILRNLNHIKAKAEVLQRLGYIYVCGFTPNKPTYYCPENLDLIINQENFISAYLKNNNVKYIDFIELFRSHTNPKSLFQYEDSHISPKGAKLMSNEIVKCILDLDRNNDICLSELFSEPNIPQ